MASPREYHTVKAEIQTADNLPNSGFAEAKASILSSENRVPFEAADKSSAEEISTRERDQYIMLSSLF